LPREGALEPLVSQVQVREHAHRLGVLRRVAGPDHPVPELRPQPQELLLGIPGPPAGHQTLRCELVDALVPLAEELDDLLEEEVGHLARGQLGVVVLAPEVLRVDLLVLELVVELDVAVVVPVILEPLASELGVAKLRELWVLEGAQVRDVVIYEDRVAEGLVEGGGLVARGVALRPPAGLVQHEMRRLEELVEEVDRLDLRGALCGGGGAREAGEPAVVEDQVGLQHTPLD